MMPSRKDWAKEEKMNLLKRPIQIDGENLVDNWRELLLEWEDPIELRGAENDGLGFSPCEWDEYDDPDFIQVGDNVITCIYL